MMQTLHIPGLASVKVYHGAICKADQHGGAGAGISIPESGFGSKSAQERDAWVEAHEHDDRLIHRYTEVRIITG